MSDESAKVNGLGAEDFYEDLISDKNQPSKQYLVKSRGGYASHVTKLYNELVKLVDKGCSYVEALQQYNKLHDAIEQFSVAHSKCYEVDLDPEQLESLAGNFKDMEAVLKAAAGKISELRQSVPIDRVGSGDSASQVPSSCSSTASARAKAAARKSALKAKLEYHRKQQELEQELFLQEQKLKQERIEIEHLKLEADYQAAAVEEETLANYMDNNYSPKLSLDGKVKFDTVPVDRCRSSNISYQFDRRPTPVRPPVNVPPQNQFVPELKSKVQESPQEDMQQKLIDVMTLPKTSLKHFSGDPVEFWSFMCAFDSAVGNTTVDDGTKLNRLLEYCTGKAAKVIQCCTFMNVSEGYTRARKLLVERFGNEYQISEAWIKRVTEGPQLRSNCGQVLQDLADDLKGCVETLKAINMIGEIDTRLRMVKIVSCLPMFLQSRWRKDAVSTLDLTGRYPSIMEFVTFLERVAKELNDPVFGTVPEKAKVSKKDHSQSQTRFKSSSFNVSTTERAKQVPVTTGIERDKNYNCYLCKQDHMLNKCEKVNILKQNRLCFNCMLSWHASKISKISGCDCGRKHAQVLHEAFESPQNVVGEKSVTGCTFVSLDKPGFVALPIVSVIIKCNGKEVLSHALLDLGSNRTFCAKDLVDKFDIQGVDTELTLETLNKGKCTKAQEVSFQVTGKRNGKHISLTRVLALDSFPKLNNYGVSDLDIDRWEHLKGLTMPKRIRVQLLIGQDHPQALIPLEIRRGKDREPYAVRTMLGWTINGQIIGQNAQLSDMSSVCNFVNSKENPNAILNTQVEKFWKVDTTPDIESVMSVDDKKVLKEWNDNLKVVNGHYQLPIPFICHADSLDMPDNRNLAEKRLISLGRRLNKNPELLQKYKDGIVDLVEKGYAEYVPEDQAPCDVVWYLPHHNVVNLHKPEKFRIVFDCAAEYQAVSLNKRVLQGPDLTRKLLGVLLRFRKHKIAMISDIEAMFHQVSVEPRHRDALRFLWWKEENLDGDIQTYRMTSHLFGWIWSPSAANVALRHTAEDNKEYFPPDVISVVLNNFYVDDCLVSVPDETSFERMFKQLNKLVATGGFRLVKWMSNSREVLQNIPADMKAKSFKDLDLDLSDTLPVEKPSGINWITESDKFGVKINQREPIHTSRGLLSIMSSVYDPIGMVAPYVLHAKLLFQAECRSKRGWDDPLDSITSQKWTQWLDDLPLLQNLTLNRCLFPPGFDEVDQLELHHFSDASEKAYGAVSYLRLVDKCGNIHCSLILGKSRLAPIKMISVPRLELLAAVVAVKVDATIQTELNLDINRTVFWCDSTIVLQYIKNKSLLEIGLQ